MTHCTLCNYHDRATIERKIATRELSMTDAARMVGCDKASISRHMTNHLTAKIAKAAEKTEISEGLNAVNALLEQLEEVRGVLKRARDRGGDQGDRTALKALAEWRKNIELTARITGEFSDAPQVNLMMSPLFVKIQQVMIETLLPYPEARVALSKGLDALAEEMENGELNERGA